MKSYHSVLGFPKRIFPRATSQVTNSLLTNSKVATPQICKFPKRQVPKFSNPSEALQAAMVTERFG